MEVRPFFVEPREDQIFFASGSSEVAGSEIPKLEKTLRWIQDGISQQRVRRGCNWEWVYVGGYTDTVGSADAKRKLSAERAASIARFFRKRGVEFKFCIRIWEAALAVKTAIM